MSYIVGDLPVLLRVMVRREFTQNMEITPHQTRYISAVVLGIRCIPGRSLQFHVRFDDEAEAGCMFIVPIQGICWKPCLAPHYEIQQPWDCFSSDFSVHEFALLRSCNGYILNHTVKGHPNRIMCKYICTVDFTNSALADDTQQHKQLHIVMAAGGWIAAIPNNRYISEDTAFQKTCIKTPRFASMEHNFSSECTIGIPKADDINKVHK